MAQIINPGDTAEIKVVICATKRIILTYKDEKAIREIIRKYLKGKMNNDK